MRFGARKILNSALLALALHLSKHRRRAMKNSWEGSANDILLAGNIGLGRLDPDSPAIGHALQRLEQSTKYVWTLVAEIKQLQTTARTLFNQSAWAYDPGKADAREYILRCEEACRQLQQTD